MLLLCRGVNKRALRYAKMSVCHHSVLIFFLMTNTVYLYLLFYNMIPLIQITCKIVFHVSSAIVSLQLR